MLIEIDGVRLLTDPVWGPRASPLSLAGPKRFQPVPVTLREMPPVDVVIVSHDSGVVASYVDAVACINRRLVAHGRPDEVLTSDALEQMYGCEAMLFQHGRVPHMVVEKQT